MMNGGMPPPGGNGNPMPQRPPQPGPQGGPQGGLPPGTDELMQTVDTNNPLTMLLLRRLNDLSPEEGDELQRLISPELGMILAKILPEIAPFILTAVPYQGGAMPPAAGGGSGAPAAPGGPMPGGPMQPPPSMNRLQAVSA